MARKKRMGLIATLTKLDQVLEKAASLEPRLARIERILFGSVGLVPRGPKPGGKRGRKPGRKATAKKACSIPGCKRPHYAKGLCQSHYQSERRKKIMAKKAEK